MGSAHFHYPLTLTSLHLLFQTIATRLLHRWTDLIAPPTSSPSYALLPLTEPKEDGELESQSAEERRADKAAAVEISWVDWRNLMCVRICVSTRAEADPVPPSASPPAYPPPSCSRWCVRICVWTRVGADLSLSRLLQSLVLSNAAYLYLSTAYIHMLSSSCLLLRSLITDLFATEAFSPVAILLAAFAFRTKAFSVSLPDSLHTQALTKGLPQIKLVLIVLVISLGVGMASYGEAAFSLTGFLIQVHSPDPQIKTCRLTRTSQFTAICVEATRVTLIQILLQGKEMSPLKTLYYFAPVSPPLPSRPQLADGRRPADLPLHQLGSHPPRRRL